jgi:hypothetical protein
VTCDDGQKEGWDTLRPGTEARAEIKTVTLDQFTNFFPPSQRVGGIKLDVEGHTYFVFEGAKEFLRKHKVPYLLLEFDPRQMQPMGYTPDAHFKQMQGLGYDIRVESFEGPIMESWHQLETEYTPGAYCAGVYLTLKKE